MYIMKYPIVSYGCSTENRETIKRFIEDLFIGKTYKLVDINSFSTSEQQEKIIGVSILFVADDPYTQENPFIFECGCNYTIIISDLVNNTAINMDNVYYLNIKDGMMCAKMRIKFLRDNNFIPSIDDDVPFVSCICPTYNRHNFLPTLFKLFNDQDYPKELCELVVLDDSTNGPFDVKKYNVNNNIRYYHIKTDKPIPIGKKRNLLHQLIKGKYIVCFDDDDFYPPSRISHCIEKLRTSDIKIAGSSELYVYYCHIKKIYKFGPYSETHATNGTLGYHFSVIFDKYYDDNSTVGEEKKFLENFQKKIVQLQTRKTILCISHKHNTFDKKNIIQSGQETKYKLKDFIVDDDTLKIYESIEI